MLGFVVFVVGCGLGVMDPDEERVCAGCTSTEDPSDSDLGEPPELVLPTFEVWNRAEVTRTEWVKVSLPFPDGMLPVEGPFEGWEVEGEPGDLVPLKWHYDADTGERSSVAIAQFRVPMTLEAGERRTVTPEATGLMVPPFEAGPETTTWLGDGSALAGVVVTLTVPGDPEPWSAALLGGALQEIAASDSSVTYRFRGHFWNAEGEMHALSLTTYLTLDALQDHGELVFQIGNDTLEHPVGGIPIENVAITTVAPFRIELRERALYGVDEPVSAGGATTWTLLGDTEIADGAAVPFRGRWAVTPSLDSPVGESFLAAAHEPLLPLAAFDAWQASGAAGPTGVLLDPRFDSLEDARAELDPKCTEVLTAGPFDELGFLNIVPGWTGDQGDFASGVHRFFLEAVQTGSPCSLREPQMAADRESLRPSFYWMTKGTVEDRATAADYPDLFFWGGRVHYDPSWNTAYPEWAARASLPVGDSHGWVGMDDQHYGNNTVREVYELTGDPYLKEILAAHQTLIVWNYLSGWMASLSAERAVGRTLKEAVLLYAYDDDTETARLLRDRTIEKNRDAVQGIVDGFIGSYGVAAAASVVDDARISLCTDYPGQEVAGAWQTGFHMEFQSLAMKNGWDPETASAIADAYLDAAAVHFAEDGSPVTYFLLSDPSVDTFGGIGEVWWSGWVNVARARPSHPESAFIESVLAPRLRTLLEPTDGSYWIDDDRWRSFE